MQETLVIIIVLMAAAAAINHFICSLKAMNGEENPCQHCASSCNCRLKQEKEECKKEGKEEKTHLLAKKAKKKVANSK